MIRKDNIAIDVQNVSKSFSIHAAVDKSIPGRALHFFKGGTTTTFRALDAISFTVHTGECIGIIGENGSGKSTLLRIISHILVPTSGTVQSAGRIVPIIELGTGMVEELTGEENVLLYGQILGIEKSALQKKLKQIMRFSEVSSFAQEPLTTFSSGMRARLAFAIAKETDPDILILDEVFAVGDKRFKEKSKKVLETFKKRKKTIFITTHHTSQLLHFCDKVLWLHKGRIVAFDKTRIVIEQYEKNTRRTRPRIHPRA